MEENRWVEFHIGKYDIKVGKFHLTNKLILMPFPSINIIIDANVLLALELIC